MWLSLALGTFKLEPGLRAGEPKLVPMAAPQYPGLAMGGRGKTYRRRQGIRVVG
jgi:hypothetical protein